MAVIIPARTVREFKQLMKTDPSEVSFIRSMNDWELYIRRADSDDHPLKSLTQEDIAEFTRSLVFRNGGIAGAYVGMLKDKLTYNQYESLITKFGLDLRLAADYADYYCSSKGNCGERGGYICTSNC
ncbi:hypothetical protein H6F61_11645 [Cyanobacteria bacterium FACHB-472]|nr:hypothetical protein [Cyanobacteria bacterium FACHB-472]